ncbi:MAG: DNA polymerase III subunit beta [Elusimicrobiota bacterium]
MIKAKRETMTKIICSKSELLRGVALIQSAISPKVTLPILSNFLVEVKNNKIKLSATDLQIGVSCIIKGEILSEGYLILPAKRVADIIRELPEKDIEIFSEQSEKETFNVYIKCGKTRFTLTEILLEDYPVLPEFKEEKSFAIGKEILKEIVKKTIFATSVDETRFMLNGLYFVSEEKNLKVVATDGRRLAYVNKKDVLSVSMAVKSIIPTKTINELIRILASEEEETVRLSMDENQIAFKIGQTVLVSRLIDAIFPNYEQVIPKEIQIKIKLNTDELLSATRRVAILSGERTSQSVKYRFSENKLRIIASFPGVGEAEDELEVVYQGEPIEVVYNPNYVLDVLKNIEAKEIELQLSNPLSPGIVRPAEQEDYLCVLMPLRNN